MVSHPRRGLRTAELGPAVRGAPKLASVADCCRVDTYSSDGGQMAVGSGSAATGGLHRSKEARGLVCSWSSTSLTSRYTCRAPAWLSSCWLNPPVSTPMHPIPAALAA